MPQFFSPFPAFCGALLCGFVALCASGAEAQQTNLPLIANGDFEDATLENWSFRSRRNSGGSVTKTPEAYRGSGAALLSYDGKLDWTLTNTTLIPVQPYQAFRVEAWVRGSGSMTLAVAAFSKGERIARDIGSDGVIVGPQWQRLEAEAYVPEDGDHVEIHFIGDGPGDVQVDDVKWLAGPRVRIKKEKPLVQGHAQERVRELLGRGLVALPMAGNKVYLGWRLLDDDPSDEKFHIYRRSGQSTVRLTAQPVPQTTNFVDEAPPEGENSYFVRVVANGREGIPSDSVSATPSATGRPYVSLKLDGEHTVQKVGIADLDGDGHLDFVLKRPNANVDPYNMLWQRSPDTFKIEAYRHDGTFLWRHDMGWAIEQGMWYSPFVVYDFDGDGRAEVACKSGEGDPRDEEGRVTTGPEFLSILDGLTGREITRVDWPSREGFPSYNFYSRNQLGVAYLDGKTPCLIVERGTYNTQKIVAYEFHGGKLRELWNWNDDEDAGFRGQGAHCLRAADVDGDGRDEVIYGSAVLDDNGTGLWSTRLGHPDHVTVGDLDPTRPGLEIQYGLEIPQRKNGICMVDAATGKILWGLNETTKHIHGTGLCADLDAAHPGVESYGGERNDKSKRWMFNAQGQLIATRDFGNLGPYAALWDADPQRELLAGKRLRDFNASLEPIAMVAHDPEIEGKVIAIADFLGDWREEIITTLPGEIRIYSTTIPATDRRVTLLRDPIYRLDVVALAQGYWQVPGLLRPITAAQTK